MSNKPLNQLNELDRLLRQTVPIGQRGSGGMAGAVVDVTIEKLCSFELFNTRPYHNYETWSDGYRVTGRGVVHAAEDLDDAIRGWCEKVETNT